MNKAIADILTAGISAIIITLIIGVGIGSLLGIHISENNIQEKISLCDTLQKTTRIIDTGQGLTTECDRDKLNLTGTTIKSEYASKKILESFPGSNFTQ
jgi:hypothetical protein